MSHLTAMLHSNDLVGMATQLFTTLSKGTDTESIIPIVTRTLMIGAMLAALRKIVPYITDYLRQIMFPTAFVQSMDPAYDWITAWIAQDEKAQTQLRDFQLATQHWREVRKRNASGVQALNPSENWWSSSPIGHVVPTFFHNIRLNHKGNYIWVTRKQRGFAHANPNDGYFEHYQIRTIALRSNILKDFFAAAHQLYHAKEANELLIFHAERVNSEWQKAVSRPSRPWSSVILPDVIKEGVLRDMEKFFSDREQQWYASRGIPYRRGYLLHGAPGAGKTTLVTALASKMNLNIYVINPAQRGMDDAKLSKLIRVCPPKSVILIEDIDCIFPSRSQETSTDSNTSADGKAVAAEPATPPKAALSPIQHSGQGQYDLAPSVVTMSGLLNAIDGVSSQEGCVLVGTTNHPERLDPALSRAGRFDVHVPFTSTRPSQARALYLHFYPLADFQKSPEPPKSQLGDLSNRDLSIEENSPIPFGSCPSFESQDELDELADRFVLAFFAEDSDEKDVDKAKEELDKEREGKLSMASLQGYLLKYKEDPIGAVRNAKTWVEDKA
ncbi:hypothetical protein IAR55_000248 [Kwoniella newhampshirensis]|uniref:Mitochondrial chaperone BCS1 n=1 Tax=Kwoniella newhampshirensis TaxID=1651941 RepID=A0AAW0Z674_9TREE